MASAGFLEAGQHGDVDVLRQLIQSTADLDINGKDEHGMTALAYSARNGHTDAVRELLAHGADKGEVLEQGYGLNNADVAHLLGAEASQTAEQQQQHPSSGEDAAQMQSTVPVDAHGGRQMPDGTVSYMNAGNVQQGFPMMAPMGPHFYDGMPPNGFAPNGGGVPPQRPRHGRKESSVNLPPPEIARMIPCKYFPNCRYGDKCVFAHPIAMAGPPQGTPLSPSMSSHPPMQPMFYQQMPPGYPYPPYGAPPHQQFMHMGHPSQMGQYGMPPHFGQGMMQPQPFPQQQQQPQPPMHLNPSMAGSPAAADAQSVDHLKESAVPQHDAGSQGVSDGPDDIPSQAQALDSEQTQAPASELAQVDAANGASTQNAPAADATSAEGASHDASAAVVAPAGDGADAQSIAAPDATASQDGVSKPVHRRQSFNSFLHHHAIPFQPQGADVLAGTSQRAGGLKGRRAGPNGPATGALGVNGAGSGKRSNNGGERPPCTFFAAGRCRFGDECRFPHVLADGTDARPMQAQQRQMYASQFASGSGPAPVRTNHGTSNGASGLAPGSANPNANSSAPASAPTGPQADKKAQQQHQQHQQHQHQHQQQQQQQQQEQQPPPPQQQQQTQQQQQQQQPNANTSGKSAPSSSTGAQQPAHGHKPSHQNNGVVRSNPSKTSTQAAAAAAASSSRGSKKQQHNHKNDHHDNKQQQQQGSAASAASHQRVPTVNDFPALSTPSPSLNGAASPQPSTVTAPPLPSSAGHANGSHPVQSVNGTPNEASAKVPKVNFSAILSAPAPVKPKTSPQPPAATLPGRVESKEGSEVPAATNGAGEDSHEDDESSAKPASAAAALAAAPNGVPKVNGSAVPNGNGKPPPPPPPPPQQQQQQPRANGQKSRGAGRESNGSTQSGKGSQQQQTSYRTAAATTPQAPAGDDDFQLVNRSRSNNKRSPPGNGNGSANGNSSKAGDGFAPQAKAVAA